MKSVVTSLNSKVTSELSSVSFSVSSTMLTVTVGFSRSMSTSSEPVVPALPFTSV